MKVSIIITAVKDRGWLKEAIQSALNQDYTDYEIILASDGNPELKKYADKWGLGFSLSNGSRFSINFNKASEIAKGEFLKVLADDDLLMPNCLNDLVKNIGNNALIFANAINFWGKSEKIYKPPMRENFKELLKRKSSYLHSTTIMFRKDIFINLGSFDEKLKSCEEYDLYLNLLSKDYKFAYLDKVVCKYRKHKGQKSHIANTPERIKDKNYIISKYDN